MKLSYLLKKADIRKRLPLLALLLMCYIPLAFSQSANALYLKDGSRVIGYVLQLDSLGDVRMQTTDGNVLSFPMQQVDKINWSYVIKEQGAGAIYRVADKYCWKRNNTLLTDRDYERFFDDELYHTYVGGSNQFNIGGACWVYGITCMVISICNIDFNSRKQDSSVYFYAGGANVLICLGCVFTGIGKGRLEWVEKTFNSQNAATNELSDSPRLLNSIKLNPSVMLSARNDLAFGATLSLSF